MDKTFQELPHWRFRAEEVSAGCYRIKGDNALTGGNLDLSGQNAEQVFDEARKIAQDMDRQTHRKLAKS